MIALELLLLIYDDCTPSLPSFRSLPVTDSHPASIRPVFGGEQKDYGLDDTGISANITLTHFLFPCMYDNNSLLARHFL